MREKLYIYSVAPTCEASHWAKQSKTWAEIVQLFRMPKIGTCTAAEYWAMDKSGRGKAKDLGAYIPAELKGGSRKKENILNRTFLAFDLDKSVPIAELIEAHEANPQFEIVIHSTRSHTEQNPAHRILVPISRPALPHEYEALARRVATKIKDISFFDPSTFDINRLMHFPSVNSDALAEYEFYHKEGDFVDVDKTLAEYSDYSDMRQWAFSESEAQKAITSPTHKKKQADPAEKSGAVGTFCRAFTIAEAIAEIIPEMYSAGEGDRYTYLLGSGQNGAVCYENKFLFSHHGTDPTHGTLCNAWDLVRVHKFGRFDKDGDLAQGTDKKSYKKMLDFVKTLPKHVAQEKRDELKRLEDAFGRISPPEESGEKKPQKVEDKKNKAAPTNNWENELAVDGKGKLKSCTANILLVLRNDPELKGLFFTDEFSGDIMQMRAACWNKTKSGYPSPITDNAHACLRNYLNLRYEISGKQLIEDAFCQVAEENSFHPVKELIEAENWDGVSRIDNLFTRLYGVKNTAYHRACARKLLAGMVARIYEAGCKFDFTFVLTGAQGAWKSSLVRYLASGKYYTDTFRFAEGKEPIEQIQDTWLVEVPELVNFKKKEAAEYKAFLTKQSDKFRPAYGRHTVVKKRQCVFIATTNDETFFRDETGNRRFLPINVGKGLRATMSEKQVKEVWRTFESEIPQIYAEALVMYNAGEPLELDEDVWAEAEQAREIHFDADVREGAIEEFIRGEVAPNWDKMSLEERKLWNGTKTASSERRTITTAEIWVECFGHDLSTFDRRQSSHISAMLKRVCSKLGWERSEKSKRFGKSYGVQSYYFKPEIIDL